MPATEINRIIETAADAAAKYPCISRIGVFGSYARGDDDESSDIDIVYDCNYNLPNATHQFLSFVEEFLEKAKPLKVDFVFIENLLESEDEEFKQGVLNDVIWIYEDKV